MTPAERAARIVQVARANPGALLCDLASACERSEKWTARVLREAGITFPEAQKPAPMRSPRSAAAAATRQIKRLISEAQNAGCVFEKTFGLGPGGRCFFQVRCPDDATKVRFEAQIRAHAERIYELLFPAPTRSRTKRPICPNLQSRFGLQEKRRIRGGARKINLPELPSHLQKPLSS
jgi:hypothetical protein